MDKETFDCEEYSSVPEMQYFSAERFNVNEALNFSLETYNAPEIAKQQESKNTSSAEGMSIDGFRGKVIEIGIRTTKLLDNAGNIKIMNHLWLL